MELDMLVYMAHKAVDKVLDMAVEQNILVYIVHMAVNTVVGMAEGMVVDMVENMVSELSRQGNLRHTVVDKVADKAVGMADEQDRQ